MGSGANIAFRRSVLLELGAFDAGLSAPRGDEGAGDSDMLTRLLNRGHLLVFRPDPVVSYTHDREIASARRLVRAKAAAHGVRRIVLWRSGTIGARTLVSFAAGYLGGLCWRLLRPRKRSRSLVLAELLGTLSSPWGYVVRPKQADSAAFESAAAPRTAPH